MAYRTATSWKLLVKVGPKVEISIEPTTKIMDGRLEQRSNQGRKKVLVRGKKEERRKKRGRGWYLLTNYEGKIGMKRVIVHEIFNKNLY